MTFLEQVSEKFLIVVEAADIFLDFEYLLCFPHHSPLIIIIMCFSIFFPFAWTLLKHQNDLPTTLKAYFGFIPFGGYCCQKLAGFSEPLPRQIVLMKIGFFEDLV